MLLHNPPYSDVVALRDIGCHNQITCRVSQPSTYALNTNKITNRLVYDPAMHFMRYILCIGTDWSRTESLDNRRGDVRSTHTEGNYVYAYIFNNSVQLHFIIYF